MVNVSLRKSMFTLYFEISQTNFSSAFYGVLHDFKKDDALRIFKNYYSPESGRAICEIGFPFFYSNSPTKVDEKNILCPTLIIGSGRDRITPIQISKKLKKKTW